MRTWKIWAVLAALVLGMAGVPAGGQAADPGAAGGKPNLATGPLTFVGRMKDLAVYSYLDGYATSPQGNFGAVSVLAVAPAGSDPKVLTSLGFTYAADCLTGATKILNGVEYNDLGEQYPLDLFFEPDELPTMRRLYAFLCAGHKIGGPAFATTAQAKADGRKLLMTPAAPDPQVVIPDPRLPAVGPPGAGPPRRSAKGLDVASGVKWLATPDGSRLAQSYPAEALRAGVAGKAALLCRSSALGELTDCAIESESPEGFGFGAAALKLTPSLRADTKDGNGIPVAGRFLRASLAFRLDDPMPSAPAPGAALSADPLPATPVALIAASAQERVFLALEPRGSLTRTAVITLISQRANGLAVVRLAVDCDLRTFYLERQAYFPYAQRLWLQGNQVGQGGVLPPDGEGWIGIAAGLVCAGYPDGRPPAGKVLAYGSFDEAFFAARTAEAFPK